VGSSLMTNADKLGHGLRKLRHLYQQMINGYVRPTPADVSRAAEGLLAPAIADIETVQHLEMTAPEATEATELLVALTAEKAEAAKRLRTVLVHLRLATSMAKMQVVGGTAGLGVIARGADGKSGIVTASFESEEFFKDLDLVLGEGPLEDDADEGQDVAAHTLG